VQQGNEPHEDIGKKLHDQSPGVVQYRRLCWLEATIGSLFVGKISRFRVVAATPPKVTHRAAESNGGLVRAEVSLCGAVWPAGQRLAAVGAPS
jgi:hypothetical protein